jgi:hypothetical protein
VQALSTSFRSKEERLSSVILVSAATARLGVSVTAKLRAIRERRILVADVVRISSSSVYSKLVSEGSGRAT